MPRIISESFYKILLVIILLGAVVGATVDSKVQEDTNNAKNNEKIVLLKSYRHRDAEFSIKYPSNWIYEESDNGSVVFSGEKNTLAFYSTINIQIVLSKKGGGQYKSVKDIIADVKNQILKESPQTTFLKSGPFVLTTSNGFKLDGEFLIFIYSYEGHIMEQWQVVIPKKDGLAFYTWAYTAPISQYSLFLPVADAMLTTWIIH